VCVCVCVCVCVHAWCVRQEQQCHNYVGAWTQHGKVLYPKQYRDYVQSLTVWRHTEIM